MARATGSRGAGSEPYHHGDLRRALLDGALRLIEESGIHHLSLREVARRAGVSHAAPYRHFPDKNALLAAIALEGFALLTESLVSARVPGKPLFSFLESAWAYVSFALAHPAHMAVMFGTAIDEPAACPGLPEESAGAFQVLVHYIEEAQRAGALRTADSRTLAMAAWSLVHGLAMLVNENGGIPRAQAESMTRALTEILLNGMKASVDQTAPEGARQV